MSNYDTFVVRKALSSETRDRIVSHLIEKGPTSVEDIADALGMTHSAISHQLSFLNVRNILACEKQGRNMIYQVAKTPAGKTARAIMRI